MADNDENVNCNFSNHEKILTGEDAKYVTAHLSAWSWEQMLDVMWETLRTAPKIFYTLSRHWNDIVK